MTFDERKEDAKTMKPRAFMLELTDYDMDEFLQLAERNGTTPEEILQGFICDLVDGSHTHGSDERMYAEQYLDRCHY
jgi:hypothetical protein